MKNLIVATLLSLIVLSSGMFAQSRLRHIKSNPVKQKPASTKAIATFTAFFEYVKKSEPDIVEDKRAQERWLSRDFRKVMRETDAAWAEYIRKNPTDKPEGPSNSSFTGVWNQPTTFSIVSSREYDYRNKVNPRALRTMIDVLYVWGNEKGPENQYPGIRNLRTFVFILEDGGWKLDDIYVFGDEFNTAESLHQYLRNDRPQ